MKANEIGAAVGLHPAGTWM